MIDALPLLLGPEGYNISRSVRLRSSASAYFNRTVWGSGNRKTWAYSFWLKRGLLGSERVIAGAYDGTSTWASRFLFTAGDALAFDAGGAAQNQVVTAAVFRDPSAFYHVLLAIDTTQTQTAHSLSDSRVRIYVNGVQQTTSGTMIGLNVDTQFFINTRPNYIGTRNLEYFDGYLTEINFINGQALTPSSFGETDAVTGVWKPKKYTGTYGTNGFYLNFSDNSNNTAATIGKDYSGNGNNWTPNNISVTSGSTYDSMLDVPTQWADGGNGRGNYCVMNPLEHRSNRITPTDGNITVTLGTGSNAYFGSRSTMGVATGKWYWEVNVVARDSGAGSWVGIGIVLSSVNWPAGNGLGANSGGYEYLNDGFKWGAGSVSAYGATYNNGDVIGVALDADAQTLTFYKNGVSQGTAFSSIGSGESWFPTAEIYRSTGTTQTLAMNFGQRPFSYTPPSGFKALNTLNLPAPTILKGNQYFDATTYTGTGASLSVTNSGAMQPDLVWIKKRNSATNGSHQLVDAVRGTSAYLFTDATNAEITATDRLTAFNSNGFSLSTASQVNGNTDTFVGWQWKEGATQGFDIVTYTGTGANRTVSHSLGVAPRMIIIKGRDGTANNWIVYHASVGNTAALFLNLTNAQDVGSAYWNNTTPTSTQFSLSTSSGSNSNGVNYVAYLFSEVAGFSRFGSYTGNGSTDGPFVYTGFRVKYLLCKRTDVSEGWQIMDAVRNTYNVANTFLEANQSNAEGTSSARDVDFLSNGFKIRNTSNAMNASGGTYIFAAFSESPFKNALAR